MAEKPLAGSLLCHTGHLTRIILVSAVLLVARGAPATDTTTECILPPRPDPPPNPCANQLLCPSDAICENRGSLYECRCALGYTFNSPLQKCEDVNECESNIDDCAKTGSECTNTIGSYTCQCVAPYVGDGRYCENKGVAGCSSPCPDRTFCVRMKMVIYKTLVEVYDCICQVGFKRTDFEPCADVKECRNSPCDNNAHCTELAPSFSCKCNVGYEGNGRYCQDIDECANDQHNCDVNADCTNTDGSFLCTCKYGFTGDGHICTRICPTKTECELFLENPNSPAEDPDICGIWDGLCPKNSVCENKGDSYHCIADPGFTCDGQRCTDIDECALSLHDCMKDRSVCTNTVGSYTCACKPEYTGDGKYCGEKSDCDICDDKQRTYCVIIFSAVCLCQVGYTENSDHQCIDVNECTKSPSVVNCHEKATCVNLNPHYRCECNSGYQGNGVHCQDINECLSDTHNCDTNAICQNTEGSFTCACKYGYTGDGVSCEHVCPQPTLPPQVAPKIDYCASIPCHNEALCTTTDSGFTCKCQPGFSGILCESVTSDRLYPFGVEQGDKVLCGASDMVARAIPVDQGLQIMLTRHRTLNVDSNGFVTLGSTHEAQPYFPRPFASLNSSMTMVAPLWADTTSGALMCVTGESVAYYHVYAQDAPTLPVDDKTRHVLALARDDVRRFSDGDTTFNASLIVVVTWYEGIRYPLSDFQKTTQRISFQLVLASDQSLYRTYALFNYGPLTWLNALSTNVGYVISLPGKDNVIFEHDLNTKDKVFSLDTQMGNTGVVGRWIYRLTTDDCEHPNSAEYRCRLWAAAQHSDLMQDVAKANLPKCPCTWTEAQSLSDQFDILWKSRCAASNQKEGTTMAQLCCYDAASNLITTESLEAGSLQLYHPTAYPDWNLDHDRNPKILCCQLSDNCDLFYQYRPIRGCQ